MKALLVTSEITYVPRNYADLFDALLNEPTGAPDLIGGLVVLKGFSFNLLKTVGGLYWLGAPRVASTLLKNMVEMPMRRREKMFEARGLPVLQADSMNDPHTIEWVRAHGFDLIVNVRTRCIYKKTILETPPLGCVNIHHGLLPEYRGTMCDLFALSESRPAGFTIHSMTEKIDAGRILVRQAVSQGSDRDYISYLARTGREEGRALSRLLRATQERGRLPEGMPNQCERPIFTKTPKKRAEIRLLRERGIQL